MTDLPRTFCPDCRQPLDGRIHGLYKEHWECYETRMEGLFPSNKYGEPEHEAIFDPEWRPVPDEGPSGPKACGWLSPDGKFYGGLYGDHIELGRALAKYFYDVEDSKALEKRGWGHIGNTGFYLDDIDRKPTQAQLDVCWDWFQTLEPSRELYNPYQSLSWLLRPKD